VDPAPPAREIGDPVGFFSGPAHQVIAAAGGDIREPVDDQTADSAALDDKIAQGPYSTMTQP